MLCHSASGMLTRSHAACPNLMQSRGFLMDARCCLDNDGAFSRLRSQRSCLTGASCSSLTWSCNSSCLTWASCSCLTWSCNTCLASPGSSLIRVVWCISLGSGSSGFISTMWVIAEDPGAPVSEEHDPCGVTQYAPTWRRIRSVRYIYSVLTLVLCFQELRCLSEPICHPWMHNNTQSARLHPAHELMLARSICFIRFLVLGASVGIHVQTLEMRDLA